MIKRLILGAIVGGVIVFAWGAVSHMLLPTYEGALLPFPNEEAVEQAVVENTPQSGVYFLPYIDQEGLSEEEQQAAMEEAMRGPVAFTAIRLGPARSFGSLLITELLIDMLAALLVTAILLQARPMSYVRLVLFVIGIALVGGIAVSLPYWNWYNFSARFTAADFFDQLMGWGLAGLALARIARPKTATTATTSA